MLAATFAVNRRPVCTYQNQSTPQRRVIVLTVMMNLSVLLLVSGVLAAGQRDQDQGLLIYDQRLIE